MIAQAQSGTGKTATFSISILQSIDTTVRETQVQTLNKERHTKVTKQYNSFVRKISYVSMYRAR